MTVTVRNMSGLVLTFKASQYHCQRYNTGRLNDTVKLITLSTSYKRAQALSILRDGFIVTVSH